MLTDLKPRGITNVSRVSCHLTCALQLLIHGVEPLREALIEIARHGKQGDAFLIQIGSFFDSYSRRSNANSSSSSRDDNDNNDDGDHNKPENPSNLYNIMQEKTSIDPHHLGDAVTALRRILQAIRTSATKTDMKSLSNIYDAIFLGGTIRQEIFGTNGSLQRLKSKNREMPCPFSITGSFASVEEGLELATMQPRPIQGYNWDEAANYEESSVAPSASGENSNSDVHTDEWKTHKLGRFVSLPQHLLLHLQRFSHQSDGTAIPINRVVHVPLTLHMATYFCNDDSRESAAHNYQLHSAILHVLDNDEDDRDDGEEGGHYVSVVFVQNAWYLLDDETVTMLSDDDSLGVLDWLSGKSSAAVESVVQKKGSYSAVLLLYRRLMCEQGAQDELLQQKRMIDNLRTEIVERRQNENDRNSSLLGKRLRVLWTKGKYYGGVVSGYNETTGKHTVQYDDGEVKKYNLKKKTIEWVD